VYIDSTAPLRPCVCFHMPPPLFSISGHSPLNGYGLHSSSGVFRCAFYGFRVWELETVSITGKTYHFGWVGKDWVGFLWDYGYEFNLSLLIPGMKILPLSSATAELFYCEAVLRTGTSTSSSWPWYSSLSRLFSSSDEMKDRLFKPAPYIATFTGSPQNSAMRVW
jgi:hypothetical protein